MLSLILFYFRLCLLRARPQDLPASQALLGLTAAANVVVGTLGISPTLGNAFAALLASLLDTAALMGFIWVLLGFRQHLPRFLQTATAALGVSLIVTACSLPLQLMLPADPQEMTPLAETASLVFLVLIVWLQVALGNVLRHAIEVKLLLGIGLAFLYSILSGVVVQSLFLPAGTPLGG